MNWLEFIASITGSLAWPGVVRALRKVGMPPCGEGLLARRLKRPFRILGPRK
jgi:hypothetical protein